MSIWILFKVSARQLLKAKVVQGLFLLNLVIAILALALGQLTFAEQGRVALDMGASTIHFCSIFFCIFVCGHYFSQDLEKQTYVPYLSRPVRRVEYLLAQFLSLLFFNFLVIIGQGLFLFLILKFMNIPVPSIYWMAFIGQGLEVMLILSFVSFVSQWASLISLWIVTFSVYLVGHWMDSLPYFIEKSRDLFFKNVLIGIQSVFFNLESLNWRPFLVYPDDFHKVSVFGSTLYAFMWTLFFLFLSYQCFRRKNLG